MSQYLTKSDLKVAMTCATKLYYKKKNYPTISDGNEYMQLLAEGGYMVGKLAQLHYPEGILIGNEQGTEYAIEETRKYLQQENVTLFEAAICTNNKLVRIDILKKEGNIFHLIEVKSKSWDSKDKTKQKKVYESVVHDICYQVLVLEEAYPEAVVKPYLLVPDKSKNTGIDNLNSLFSINTTVGKTPAAKTYEVSFNGELSAILEDDILTLVEFKEPLTPIKEPLAELVDIFIEHIKDEPKKIPVQISTACKKCEYKGDKNDGPNGFKECWGALAEATESILDLNNLGKFDNKGELSALIAGKKVELKYVPVNLVENKFANRAFHQITKNSEWLNPEISFAIDNTEYPLHFIDFETSRMALPYHKGMRPYENIAFQWSCHTINYPGAEPVHSEWINMEDSFPNFSFAESLMNCIGNKGTVLTWSHHENTILKDILVQMKKYGYGNEELQNWFSQLVKIKGKTESRILDMHELAKHFYYHPYMKGSTSIKVTLPAVLKSTRSEKISALLQNFENGLNLFAMNENGEIENPYKLLPQLKFAEGEIKVSDGTGAMRAYQEMLYGMSKNNSALKNEWSKALLRYCKLDTLAMIIIWEHWQYVLKKNLVIN